MPRGKVAQALLSQRPRSSWTRISEGYFWRRPIQKKGLVFNEQSTAEPNVTRGTLLMYQGMAKSVNSGSRKSPVRAAVADPVGKISPRARPHPARHPGLPPAFGGRGDRRPSPILLNSRAGAHPSCPHFALGHIVAQIASRPSFLHHGDALKILYDHRQLHPR